MEEFQRIHDVFVGLDKNKILRPEYGTYSLANQEYKLFKFVELIKEIRSVLPFLSKEVVNAIVEDFSNFASIIERVQKANQSEFADLKNSVVSFLSESEDLIGGLWWYKDVTIFSNKIKMEGLIEGYESISKLKAFIENTPRLFDEAKDAKAKVDDVLNNAKAGLEEFNKKYSDQLNKFEITFQKSNFSEYADNFKKNSLYWFFGILGCSAALLLYLFLSFYFLNISKTDVEKNVADLGCKECVENFIYFAYFKSVAIRLIVVSTLLFLTNFCVRNYKANMHNYTINLHKSNSLSAALILLNRAKTDQGNDALMNQAVNSIFSHQSTGYDGKDVKNVITSFTEKVIDKVKTEI